MNKKLSEIENADLDVKLTVDSDFHNASAEKKSKFTVITDLLGLESFWDRQFQNFHKGLSPLRRTKLLIAQYFHCNYTSGCVLQTLGNNLRRFVCFLTIPETGFNPWSNDKILTNVLKSKDSSWRCY